MKWDYGCEGCLKADKHVFAVPSVTTIPEEAEIQCFSAAISFLHSLLSSLFPMIVLAWVPHHAP